MSTIERLAKMAQETTPDQWVSIFSELHEQIVDLEHRLEAAERRESVLREALQSVGHNEICWCGVAIGDPRYTDHSAACKRATAALAHSAQEKADAAE